VNDIIDWNGILVTFYFCSIRATTRRFLEAVLLMPLLFGRYRWPIYPYSPLLIEFVTATVHLFMKDGGVCSGGTEANDSI